jgi:hypothetical protein
MQKYRFSNPASVVEVTEHRSKFVILKPGERAFNCLCRGYGHNNHEPRKTYVIIAATPSQAARMAIENYRKDYGQEIK